MNELNCHADIFRGNIRTPKPKNIRAFKRKAKGKEYMNPVVHLPSEFNDLIGSECWVYRGTGELKHEFSLRMGTNHKGDMVILFIPRATEVTISGEAI